MKHVIALSGGADSSAMALRLREIAPWQTYEYVITPTGDELPEMVSHWANLERLLGSELKRLPNETLFQCIARNKALPNFRMRFCTREIKIEPFMTYMDTLPAGSTMYVGLRADEEGRTGLDDPNAQYHIRHPMREWGWSREDVENYLRCRGVTIPERTDCGCCFYQKITEWHRLSQDYPERYQQYVNLEKEYGYTFRSDKRDTWPASLEGLREAFKTRPLPKPRKTKRSQMCSWCSR